MRFRKIGRSTGVRITKEELLEYSLSVCSAMIHSSGKLLGKIWSMMPWSRISMCQFVGLRSFSKLWSQDWLPCKGKQDLRRNLLHLKSSRRNRGTGIGWWGRQGRNQTNRTHSNLSMAFKDQSVDCYRKERKFPGFSKNTECMQRKTSTRHQDGISAVRN